MSNMNKVYINGVAKEVSSPQMVKVTYDELMTLCNNGELSLVSQYQLTNYHFTTTLEDTKSAGHRFDLILTPISNNALSQIAHACPHTFTDDEINPLTEEVYTEEEKNYFQGVDMSKWVIEYDINPYNLPSGTGKYGWISKMTDEHGNVCTYDFKNAKYIKTWVFDYVLMDETDEVIQAAKNDNAGVETYTFATDSGGTTDGSLYDNFYQNTVIYDYGKLPFVTFYTKATEKCYNNNLMNSHHIYLGGENNYCKESSNILLGNNHNNHIIKTDIILCLTSSIFNSNLITNCYKINFDGVVYRPEIQENVLTNLSDCTLTCSSCILQNMKEVKSKIYWSNCVCNGIMNNFTVDSESNYGWGGLAELYNCIFTGFFDGNGETINLPLIPAEADYSKSFHGVNDFFEFSSLDGRGGEITLENDMECTLDVYSNINYILKNPCTAIEITLQKPNSINMTNEYSFQFMAGVNNMPLSITTYSGGEAIKWNTVPTMTVGSMYQVSIVNGLAVIGVWNT